MRTLLHTANRGEALTYEEVLGALAAPEPAEWALHAQSGSLETVLRVLVEALATGREVTLYDADFTEGEILALTGSGRVPADTVPREPCVVSGWEAWVERVVQVAPSGFRLGLFTSGSTGLPKRVLHAWASVSRGLRVSPRHAHDVWGFAYNPTHIAGVQVALQALMNGNVLVDLWNCSREEQATMLERHGVTHLSATPTFYRLLLPLERPNPTVQRVSLGGEGSDEGLRRRLQEAFPNAKISNIYASTEAGSLFLSDGGVFTVPTAIADKVRVREGMLELHRSLLGDFAGEGDGDWYATGDRIDVVGEAPLAFVLAGRDRDWINVGGAKVNPGEVEAVLLRHPQVRAVRVYGRTNSVTGALLCAEVVPSPGGVPEEKALRDHAAAALQAFKVPRLFRFVAALEQTRSGKIKRL